MTDLTESGDHKPAKKGEAAWLETKRAVALRNDASQKAGRAERTARVQREKAARRDQERNGVYY